MKNCRGSNFVRAFHRFTHLTTHLVYNIIRIGLVLLAQPARSASRTWRIETSIGHLLRGKGNKLVYGIIYTVCQLFTIICLEDVGLNMKKNRLIMVGCCCLVVVLLACWFLRNSEGSTLVERIFSFAGSIACDNTIQATAASPDRTQTAIVTFHDCGATAHVFSVRVRSNTWRQFLGAETIAASDAPLEAYWQSNDYLIIYYESEPTNGFHPHITQIGNIRIDYRRKHVNN
jgi:hypothetical protein